MSNGKYFKFLKKKLLYKIMVAHYLKTHDRLPSVENPEDAKKLVERITKQNAEADKNCLNVDEKLKAGLTINEIKLSNTSGWLVTEDDNPSDKIIYYIHGGGFTSGNSKERFELISFIVKNFHYNVFSIDYRLAPDFKCVDTLSDCVDGYKNLLENHKAEDICLMGESAGANLVFALTLRLKDLGLPVPRGIISNSPLSQFEYHSYSFYTADKKTDFMIGKGIVSMIYPLYKGDLDFKSPYMSPLFGDFNDFPKVYIDASREESLRDDARMLFAKLKEYKQDAEYHELKYFEHAQITNPIKVKHVRKEECPLIKSFLDRIWNNTNQ